MYLTDSSRTGWDPFVEMERMLDDLNRTLARGRATTLDADAADIWADDQTVVIAIAAPGLDAGSFDISTIGETVTVRGKPVAEDATGRWLRRERQPEELVRTFQLPFAVDAERAQARYSDGILTLTLTRPESDKPRRIAVRGA
jgi:HSP20 family protein